MAEVAANPNIARASPNGICGLINELIESNLPELRSTRHPALGKIDLSKSITCRTSLDQVNRGLEILERK